MEKSTDSPSSESLEALGKFKLFAGFKAAELATLVSLAEEKNYAAGELIIREGGLGESMFVILAGEVVVFREAQGKRVEFTRMRVGDSFGELALVDDGPRSASVAAVVPTRVLRITQDVVAVLAGVRPAAAIHLLRAIGKSLVARLRTGNQRYLDIVLTGSIPIASSGDESA
ncbi:MAG TPA: cyclic nucleotide-binding domain-containing protein [Chthoniobacterales bacterium]